MNVRLKILAVVALIGGPVLTYTGWNMKQKMAKLEESGKTVPGEVVDGEEIKGRKGAQTYKVNVSFTPEGKSPVKKNFKVTKNFITKVTGGTDKIMNDACQVKYDEADPDNAVIVDGSDIDTFMFPAGLVASVLGLLGTVWMLKH